MALAFINSKYFLTLTLLVCNFKQLQENISSIEITLMKY